MRTELSVAPTATVIPLARVRDWLAMAADVTVADNLLEDLIDEVTAWVEWRTQRHIATKTVKVWLDYSEVDDTIYLPAAVPLVSVSSIVTYDEDAVTTTVAATNYQVTAGPDPRITLTDDGEWPDGIRDYEGMLITAVVGAGGDYRYAYDARCAPTLDDFVASGTSTDTAKTAYEVKISTAVTQDKYQWRTVTRDSAGIRTYGAWSAEVACSATPTSVGTAGLKVAWLATTGHTVGDVWVAERYEDLSEYQPPTITLLLRGIAVWWYSTRGLGVVQSADGRMGLPQQLAAMLDSLRVGNA